MNGNGWTHRDLTARDINQMELPEGIVGHIHTQTRGGGSEVSVVLTTGTVTVWRDSQTGFWYHETITRTGQGGNYHVAERHYITGPEAN